ncbi:uncharacterized protein [Miscanthus floridulus]|uniref:uncharacterized protein n=1 Tax=Miscanthus floridulus TaxID=154761 RepID=UPI003459891E
MPSYPLFVSLCSAMTSGVVLHALAADQDAAHFSVSLYAGKPASRDQFQKAYLKDGEASHSAGHKVLHHVVSAGSCYGEYTNFIQLLLKTRANPNISDELRGLSMEIVELCECKEEEERRLPFTLLIPNVRKWSVAGVHSHAKSDNTKLLDKIHFAGRRSMIKSQVDLAFRQECDMAFKF